MGEAIRREELVQLFERACRASAMGEPFGLQTFGKIPSIGPAARAFVLFHPLKGRPIVGEELLSGLSSEYRDFLESVTNGSMIFWSVISLYGFQDSAPRKLFIPHDIVVPNTLEREPWMNAQMVIGSFGDGSYICQGRTELVVQRRMRSTGTVLFSWPTFADFLRSELDRVEALIDGQLGRLALGSRLKLF